MNREKEKYLFEESPVMRAIFALAFPSVMGQIMLVIYNMADTFFVGLTGSDVMVTAVTVCMPAFMFLSAISNLFGVGGASVISRMLGAGRREEARRASSFAVWGCVAVTLLYSLLAFLLMDVFVDLLGGSASQVHENAVRYLFVTVVCGGVCTSMSTLLSHLIRAEGRSMQASFGIILGGLLNIALDPLFMFVLLEPGNEPLGAALATALSNAGALLYFAVLWARHRRGMVLSVRPCRAMFGQRIPRDVISIGIPACLMTLCENISYAVLDNLMSAYGTAAQAGVGVAKKVNMLAHCTVRGMAQGVLPLIGYNYQSGNRRRMHRVVRTSAFISVALSTLCMIAALLFAHPLIALFIPAGSASHEMGVIFLRIMCIGAPFSAWAYTVISFFQATGHMGRSLLLALMRKGILDIPMMYLFDALRPLEGVVCATPAADILCCLAAAVLYATFIRSAVKRQAPATATAPSATAAKGKVPAASAETTGLSATIHAALASGSGEKPVILCREAEPATEAKSKTVLFSDKNGLSERGETCRADAEAPVRPLETAPAAQAKIPFDTRRPG